jgi:hypothetical protein
MFHYSNRDRLGTVLYEFVFLSVTRVLHVVPVGSIDQRVDPGLVLG